MLLDHNEEMRWGRYRLGWGFPVLAVATVFLWPTAVGAVLEVHPDNPRWLTDDGGKTALVLSGAHAWSVFQDYDPSPAFDGAKYLDGLSRRGHNFTRGWFWEDGHYSPLPYTQVDGVYRLSPPYDNAYIKRVRRRVRQARKKDLFVSVMLFQGWSMDDRGGLRDPDPWPLNPYNRDNTSEAVSKQRGALHIGLAQGQQLDYVDHVARKLCAEPNIIWEIANESHPSSFGAPNASNWQANILAHLRSVCDRHLTWVSCPLPLEQSVADRQGLNDAMYGMTTEIIAPCDPDGSFATDPPAADGRKVLIADSDHYEPDNIDFDWVWKTFLRGQHPVFMDLTQTLEWWAGDSWDPEENRWAKVLRALGAIQDLVASVNKTRNGRAVSGLADMAPQGAPGGQPRDKTRPTSSPWALFSSGKPCKPGANGGCGTARANGDEFLVYAGASESVRVCRLHEGTPYRFRWKRSRGTGYLASAQVEIADAKGCLELENPADTTAIVHLERML